MRVHTDFKDTFSGEEEVGHFYIAEDISFGYSAK